MLSDIGRLALPISKDALKNPCLDYIEHILFQQPEYRFEVDGQSFDSFQAVKDSFVAGSLTEAALKSRLVDDINSLLEPVLTFETISRDLSQDTSVLQHRLIDLPSRATFLL